MRGTPLLRAHDLAARSRGRRQQLRRDVRWRRAAPAAYRVQYEAHPGSAEPPNAADIAADWLAARAALDRLATLRADVAEALHRVRVALDAAAG